ncbi:hypothetical protein BJY52DRAFT_1228839 [Lactarius psammicola]|nr:hypothetical protein BJY52DRAFT_1228839 [Lactarius psammicola]
MSVKDSGDGLHCLGRINKGKVPAPPDMEPIPAPQQHCKKHSTVKSTGDSDKTAHHIVAPPSHRVVVKSPPEARCSKQCLCIGKDGQATEPILSKEQDTGAPEGIWVSRGKDQREECKLSNETLCIPQWGMTKLSKACTYCTGRKRWTSFVETGWGSVKTHYFPASGQAPLVVQGTDTADTGIAMHCRRAPKKQPSPQAVANQDTCMAALEESIQELTESHKKLMGSQKQILSMMLAVCSCLGIKVIMPDDFIVFAIVHSTVSSIPSPLVDNISALNIGRAPASAAASVVPTSSTHSSMSVAGFIWHFRAKSKWNSLNHMGLE